MCGASTTFSSAGQLRRHLRLVLVDVEAGREERALLQRAGERGRVDQPAARRVDQHGARPHARERRGVDQVTCLGRERHVQRDEVRARQQLVERHVLGAEPRLLLGVGGARRVQQRDVEAAQQLGHASPDAAEADDADRRCPTARARAAARAPSRPIRPARTIRSASPMRRAAASISASASSAVAFVRTSGVFVTTTPRARHAARSMLS